MTVEKETTSEIINLVLDFHLKTGADIQDIKVFVRKIMDINTQFSIKIVREEMAKIIQP
jgi:hypothetical protein